MNFGTFERRVSNNSHAQRSLEQFHLERSIDNDCVRSSEVQRNCEMTKIYLLE